jgi:hypothetical protein
LQNLEGRDHFGHTGCVTRRILKWFIKETECKDVKWIQMAQDGVQWQAIVDFVMNHTGLVKERSLTS